MYTEIFSPLINVLDIKKKEKKRERTKNKTKQKKQGGFCVADLWLIHSKRYGITVKNPNLQKGCFSFVTPTSHINC